jgi:hypothetical protein
MEMAMRKRKELAYEGYEDALSIQRPPLIGRRQMLGLVALVLVASVGVAEWLTTGFHDLNGLFEILDGHGPSYTAPAAAPVRPAVSRVNALAGDELVIAGADGGLRTSNGSGDFDALAWRGEDVASAPDALAYRRDGTLWIARQDREWSLDRPGILPSWSANGEELAFVERTAAGDVVYALFDARQADSEPAALLTVPEIAAPPRFHPATGRLLIAERLSAVMTAFYTVDPARCILGAQLCAESRRDVGTVSYAVNWADYHPGATAIVFSEREFGDLYQMSTGDGTVTALLDLGFYARRPALSADGTRIAFLSDSGGVFVMDVRSGAVRGLPDAKASSVDWSE